MYFLPQYRRGVFNRYRKGMPVTEMLVKDFNHFVAILKQGRDRKRLLCHPHYPSRGATIFRIAKALGIELTNKPTGRFDLAIYWEYATERKEWHLLESMKGVDVLNLRSHNIGKDFLDERMLAAFGYNTRVDPASHNGVVVRKSIQNAVHDGTLVQAPTTVEQGYIYQRFIDSSVSTTEVMDLRVPVMRHRIPHLYKNFRSVDARFVNVPPRAELETDVDAVLSADEQAALFRLCDLMGLDYAEFDVLRDCHDGRIYVVDANNTPQGPPRNLAETAKARAVESYVRCFEKVFLS